MVDQLASAVTCRACGNPLELDRSYVDTLCDKCVEAAEKSSVAATYHQDLTEYRSAPIDVHQVPDPDHPPWGAAAGVGVWVASVAAIIVLPLVAIVVWLVIQLLRGAPLPNFTVRDEFLAWLTSPTLLLVQVLSTMVAHALTIVICWMVVTSMGKRPFWASLGWGWAGHSRIALKQMSLALAVGIAPVVLAVIARMISPRLGVIPLERLFPLACIGAAIGLAMGWRKLRPADDGGDDQVNPLGYWLVFSACLILTLLGVTQLLSRVLPQSEENSFAELLKSSTQVRVAVALLATLTAPFVEEAIYRGVLYSGLRKTFGLRPTVTFVTLMFVGVHVLQYFGAWVTLAGLTLLSLALTLIRARTRSVLPCVAIHTFNNAFFSVLILLNRPS